MVKRTEVEGDVTGGSVVWSRGSRKSTESRSMSKVRVINEVAETTDKHRGWFVRAASFCCTGNNHVESPSVTR